MWKEISLPWGEHMESGNLFTNIVLGEFCYGQVIPSHNFPWYLITYPDICRHIDDDEIF